MRKRKLHEELQLLERVQIIGVNQGFELTRHLFGSCSYRFLFFIRFLHFYVFSSLQIIYPNPKSKPTEKELNTKEISLTSIILVTVVNIFFCNNFHRLLGLFLKSGVAHRVNHTQPQRNSIAGPLLFILAPNGPIPLTSSGRYNYIPDVDIWMISTIHIQML